MAKNKVEKVKKTRVTLVGNVDVNEVAKTITSSFPGVEVKLWNKRVGKAQKKKVVSENDSTGFTQG